MKDGFLTVDINSMAATKKLMDSNYNELFSEINKYKEMIEETQKIYDTESGTLYRKVAIGYIELIQKYLTNELKPYIDKLDEIRKVYIDEYNTISKEIQGGTK